MQRTFVLYSKLFVTFCFLAACTGDDGPTGPAGAGGPAGPTGPTGPAGPTGQTGIENFTSALSGANEVPAVTTTAAGTATISLVGPTLLYRIDVTDITDVTGVHIHGPAAAGVNTGILVNLCGRGSAPACETGTVNGVLASGATTSVSSISFDSLVVLLRNGNTYVNVHTTVNGGGELRGQITSLVMQ